MQEQKKKQSQEENANLKNWHALEEAVIFEELRSDQAGLEPEEAVKRKSIYGANALPLKNCRQSGQFCFIK